MSKMTNEEIFFEVCTEFDEVFVGIRKGVAQTRYIALVEEDAEYWDGDKMVPVPDEVKGFWMMSCATDLKYTNFSLALKDFDWVKCERVEVITYEYKEI